MKNDCLDRLNFYIQKKGISVRSLADRIGMNEKTLGGKLNGTRGIELALFVTIIAQFEDLSSEWLLRGEGEMIKTTDAKVTIDFRHQKQGDFSAMDNGTVNVGDMEAANKAKMLSIVEKIVNSPNSSSEAMDKAMKILEKLV